MSGEVSLGVGCAQAALDLVSGRLCPVDEDAADGVIEHHSPRDLDAAPIRSPYRLAVVEEAVLAARQAQASWCAAGLDARAACLRKLQDGLRAERDALADAIVDDMGKPRWEALGEVGAAIGKVDVTLDEGLALTAERRPEGLGGRYAFKPHGVVAVIGPFNFPLHLPHGHLVPALALGNSVVLKLSEQCPRTARLYAELLLAAGFPPGVVGVVSGGAETGARLAAAGDVDVVAFTGSYAAGSAIRRATLEQPHKLLALEMGGRNPALVFADAPLDKAAHDILWGAFVTAGQRCTGTGLAYVDRRVFAELRDRILPRVASLRAGDPRDEAVFLGPMAGADALARFERGVADGRSQGAQLLAEGRAVRDGRRATHARAQVHQIEVGPGEGPGAYEREELFGPDLALIPVDDIAQGVERANALEYGLAASVFCAARTEFDWAFERLRFGCINWNTPTCGASGRLPFGGLKKSGNHRPAALFSSLYCAYPVATIEGPESLDGHRFSPGLRW